MNKSRNCNLVHRGFKTASTRSLSHPIKVRFDEIESHTSLALAVIKTRATDGEGRASRGKSAKGAFFTYF